MRTPNFGSGEEYKNKLETLMRSEIMRRGMKITFMLAILVAALFSPPANAEIITVEIAGVVTDIRDLEDYPYDEIIHVSDYFTGTYTYESSTIDSSPKIDLGSYVHDSPYGFNISLGGFEFKTAEDHVDQFIFSIFDGYSSQTYDRYIIESNQNAPLSTGISVNHIVWDIYDDTHSTISSTSLPTEAPNLSAWGSNTLSIGCGGVPCGNATFAVWGTITQAYIIPEPATLALLGLGGLFLRNRKL